MKVAIAGAGVAGRFLHRLMWMEKGVVGENEVDIFDIGNSTGCQINPCGWMVPCRYFTELLKLVELDPELYVMQRFDKCKIGEKVFPADLQIINKPTLLHDLWGDDSVKKGSPPLGKYDRIIDCTGTARAYLPALKNDTIASCIQIRGRPHEGQIPYPMIKYIKLGYAWAIPLGDTLNGGCHVGCGSLSGDPAQGLIETGFFDLVAKKECACTTGKVRVSGPRLAEPFTHRIDPDHEVWGCGESIGCVSPMVGEGIVPAMECACRLVENWTDANMYASAVMRQFDWMNRESLVLQRLLYGGRLTPSDALVLVTNASRVGLKIGIPEALDIVKMAIL